MANVIKKATNRWTKGLVMDFSPENTKNEVLTHALNATLLTFNGNEMSLQNDMGNARVETAYLPEGYMPVGTCEYGGIIYIVSYNPLEDKSLIGCFPSPERNVSSDEIGKPQVHISRTDFQEVYDDIDKIPTGTLKHNTQYVLLKNDNLNPGDKFLICSDHDIYNEKLENLLVKKDPKHNSKAEKDKDGYEIKPHPILALNVVSIEESGKIVYLNSDIRRYDVDNGYEINGTSYLDTYKYHILGTGGNINGEFNQLAIDIDSYRNALSSGYSVFKSKTSGKLAILAELIMIDSYSVTHSLKPCVDASGATIDGKFDVILHNEVEPIITNENYNTAPKLRYYYLLKSLGYILYCDLDNSINTRTLFKEDKGDILLEVNDAFLNTSLSSIYEYGESDNSNKTLKSECEFNFPYANTYHGKMVSYDKATDSINESVYTKLTEGKYHRFDYSQITDNLDYFYKNFKFYKYVEGEVGYTLVTENHTINKEYTYYIQVPVYSYVDAKRDEEHREKALYKLTTSALVATKTEIENKLVEKFQYEEIHKYELATQEDIDSGKELWYTNNDPNDLKFISLTGSPKPGVLYYIRKVERNLKSIGFDINSETITGTVYYYPTTKNYELATPDDISKYYDKVTYPYENDAPYGSPITLYYQVTKYNYKPATQEQIENSSSSGIVLFYDANYIPISDIKNYVGSELLFIVAPIDTYLTYDQFKPNGEDNYIYGSEPDKKYPKDDPLYLFTLSSFIPEVSESDNLTPYHDLKLGTILLPKLVYQHGVDLPFKYDYTIVPCMNYGRLDHLAVSNTVDFSKLHAFNKSSFTTWKYRIDDGYLRLTVGAEIFDTYETYKVDGLIFEFYDHRGFAGSLEFVDKKSYNGTFTKVIPLNSLQALSQKRILNDRQDASYKRNINIIEEYADGEYKERYYLNNKEVVYSNYLQGWKYADNPNVPIDNDCGTIYSNIVYGIKAYFRRTTESGVEYIRKQDMFVYTLPIFNEYYYKIDNFMNISNPLLLFMLTYKLIDDSIKVPYTSGDITQGYNSNNKKQIDEYISGFYNISQNTKLDLIKYYKYSGTTNLYLEVGLKLDYNNINLAYNPELNKYFTCDLQLISDNDKDSTYNVVSESSELTDPKTILNYNLNGLDLNINKLVFASTNSADFPIEKESLLSSNFIHTLGNNPIKIDYEFIVGYTVNISNIRATNVPATTVCALFHKTPDGEYNYEDFGIYKQGDELSGYQYLSNAIFYNGGTSDQEEFGLCKQVQTSGDNMLKECHIFATERTDAKKRINDGELNSGNPLKKMVPYLGKLTFCLPHAHGMSIENGVNIHETKLDDGSYLYGIPPGTEVKYPKHGEDNDYEYGYGIVPRDFLHYNPKYNLCLNTKNSILLQSEFISTLNSNIIEGNVLGINMKNTHEQNWHKKMSMREYTGFTGTLIELFNSKLLKTMSKIYAYNPDYDSLLVNVGDVTLQKYSPKFTSNIISRNSKFNFVDSTLNDYIYISNINLTKYLTDLNEYSLDNSGDDVKVKNDTLFINHLQFKADYTYCGTDVAPYLINQLTYNTVVPIEIEEELTFNKSNLIVIKHHDNTNSFISGNLNKKLLYGYNAEYNKLISLDVSNYQINVAGDLIMDGSGVKKEKDLNYTITADVSKSLYPISGTHTDTFAPEWEDGLSEEIDVTLHLNKTGVLNLIKFVEDTGEFFVTSIPKREFLLSYIQVGLLPTIQIKNNKKYYYNVYIDSIELQCGSRVLHLDILTRNNINLSQLSEETLKKLVFESPTYAITYDTKSAPVTLLNQQLWTDPELNHEIRIEKLDEFFGSGNFYDVNSEHTIILNNTGINIYPHSTLYLQDDVALYYFKIKKINYKLTRISKLDSNSDDIIINNKTTNYSKFENYTYIVHPKYKLTRLRGTSITLNDLVYEPSISGHRLFMRNSCARYDTYYRCKLYYRYLDNKTWTTDIANWEGNLDSSWKYSDTKDLNTLFLLTGPCFTENNLEKDPLF